jgi:hypothetical protein
MSIAEKAEPKRIKFISHLDVAMSKVLESPSCFSMCLRWRVTVEGILERFLCSLEVLES